MTVLEQAMGGEADTNLYQIRTYPPSESAGIIVLRFSRQDKHYILENFDRIIQLLGQEMLDRRLWIVDEIQVRIRE
jgi:hypothetical protein